MKPRGHILNGRQISQTAVNLPVVSPRPKTFSYFINMGIEHGIDRRRCEGQRDAPIFQQNWLAALKAWFVKNQLDVVTVDRSDASSIPERARLAMVGHFCAPGKQRRGSVDVPIEIVGDLYSILGVFGSIRGRT